MTAQPPGADSALAEIAHLVVACTDCALSRSRTRAVPGEGSPQAQVMFIGEAPGWYEDQQGRPFVGPAGQFLGELLKMVGIKREEVFITNMVKCRPPGNRDPLPGEIEACRKYLDAQLAALRPRVVVSLGRYSMARFFPGQSISKVHGTWRREGDTVYMALYHPAAALHQQSLRKVIQEDMLKLPLALAAAARGGEGGEPTSEQPQQLSLF